MSTTCQGCGAPLREDQSFCGVCGKRQPAPSQAEAANVCTGCGSSLQPGGKFCQKCGAPVPAPDRSASVASIPQAVSAPSAPASSTGGSTAVKVVVIVGVVVATFLFLIMGSCAYIAYRARKKVHEIEQSYQQNDIKHKGSGSRHNNPIAQNTGASTSNSSPPSAGEATAPNGEIAQAPQSSNRPPKADPVVSVAATGNQTKDWALRYERTENGPEADLVVRTGDINNLGFGWPQGFDPFSGNSTPPHRWPDPNNIPAGAPDGTDRIMIGSAVIPGPGDGYSGALTDCAIEKQMTTPPPSLDASCKRARELTMPTPIILSVGDLPAKINTVLIQMFVDDFQAVPIHSHFQVSLNGTRLPNLEYAINALDQSGPIGKLLSLKLLPEYWPLLQSGTVKLLIDDPTTHMPDGYAIDFVRILVNPHNFKYEVSLVATVVDADQNTAIPGATVTAALESASTDQLGKCQLSGLPAGLVVATAAAPGYDESSVPVDVVAGQSGTAEIKLHKHQENTADLERSIEQTGSATIYGIHFDTDSAKLRPDSMPALNAVLGLINNHPGSRWTIAGHTDNQGNAAHNQTLSEQRSASVIRWLKEHGVDQTRLVPQGYGATRPVADNTTANGRALNRRVEIAAIN